MDGPEHNAPPRAAVRQTERVLQMSHELNEKFTREVETYVRPNTFPVAIRMLKAGEAIPPKTKRPAQDLKVQIATCQGVTMARRYGWSVAIGREDLNCVLTKTAFGFEPVVPFYAEGNCACGMYTETAEAGAKTEAATARFSFREYETILLAPSAKARFEPHVYLVYGNAAQVMRMLTAALFKRGGALSASFTGRIDCADIVIRTMTEDDYQVILPCYGDRVFGQTEDGEMAFTVPFSKAGEFIAGLEGTHRGGIRYPIPTFVRYSGQFPPAYDKLAEIFNTIEESAPDGVVETASSNAD